MRNIFCIVSACLILYGCGGGVTADAPEYLGLVRTFSPVDGDESAIVNWNGDLVFVVNRRNLDTNNTGDTITRVYHKLIMVAEIRGRMAFTSAIVSDGALYIFGTVGNREVQMIKSYDLVSWTDPVTVLRSDARIYNSSVTADPNGFVMALETDEGVPYTARFYRSNDLLSWSLTGQPFHWASYAACPTIRYLNGYYYVFYLVVGDGVYYTRVDRSTDLSNWETSPYAVLYPQPGEGINTSDMDIAEVNGITHIIFSVGDQATWGDLRMAEYKGTMIQFVDSLF